MRVVFMGTPRFAVPALESLTDRHEVVAVYSRPDAVSKRGSATVPSPVSSSALTRGLELHRPASLRDPQELECLRTLKPDVIVVVAYGVILPQEVLDIPPYGCLNAHASVLPRWRGAAPIERAILAGDDITGVSIMRMEAGLDTGPYCLVRTTPTAEKTADELLEELSAFAAASLVEAVAMLETGTCVWTEQDPSLVTYAEKITKADVAISPDSSATEVLRRVRASSSRAPVRAVVASKPITIVAVAASRGSCPAGEACPDPDGVLLGCSDGPVLVTRVKPDGKADMQATDWLRGLQPSERRTWTSTL